VSRHAIALDIGGTFTDVTLMDTHSGRRFTAKVSSTLRDPSIGFIAAVKRALSIAGVDPASLERVFHGTTVATNAVLERRETTMGLITTRGFKYVLEIGRHGIPRDGNVFGWVKPARPVPPRRIEEVTERLERDGEVSVPLDEEDVRGAVARLKAQGVRSIAVCFLYSYVNDIHERRVADLMLDEHPDILVSLSCEVLPQFREYERSMATVLNAYVVPHVRSYLQSLGRGLSELGSRAPLLIMKSNAGVMGAASAAQQAIHTVLSGPVAGVLGAVECGAMSGFDNIISIDVGGTSADVCLVKDGRPEITAKGHIGEWPLQLPMVDINTIGAGGGSIARVSGVGRLSVGPQSAGADPGPACYPNGGSEPTVTDAHLVLGRIPPHLLGGEIPLALEAARHAIHERIAVPLGLGVEEAAEGILQIINNNMAGAIRTVSVARGHDPQQFALVAFGGAGPLHGVELAQLMGIPTVIVPRRPGVLSTWGMLATDLKQDYVQSLGRATPTDIAAAYAAQEARAHAWLESEQVPAADRELQRSADLRYAHQGFELTVSVADGAITQALLDSLVEQFHREHRRLYTYDMRHQPVEIISVRTTALGRLPRRSPEALTGGGSAEDARSGERLVYLGSKLGYSPVPVYRREALGPGAEVLGPGIVEQDDSTVVLLPGNRGQVDRVGNIVVKV
jgi:N-methylhydantoinase A